MFYANHSIEIELQSGSFVFVDLKLTAKALSDSDERNGYESTITYPDSSTVKIELMDDKFSHLMADIEKQVERDVFKDDVKWRKQ